MSVRLSVCYSYLCYGSIIRSSLNVHQIFVLRYVSFQVKSPGHTDRSFEVFVGPPHVSLLIFVALRLFDWLASYWAHTQIMGRKCVRRHLQAKMSRSHVSFISRIVALWGLGDAPFRPMKWDLVGKRSNQPNLVYALIRSTWTWLGKVIEFMCILFLLLNMVWRFIKSYKVNVFKTLRTEKEGWLYICDMPMFRSHIHVWMSWIMKAKKWGRMKWTNIWDSFSSLDGSYMACASSHLIDAILWVGTGVVWGGAACTVPVCGDIKK